MTSEKYTSHLQIVLSSALGYHFPHFSMLPCTLKYLEVEILQSRWQHGEKVGTRYPNRLKNAIFKCDICPAGHERAPYLNVLRSGLTVTIT
jgi:hypothetical protein